MIKDVKLNGNPVRVSGAKAAEKYLDWLWISRLAEAER